MWGPLYADCHVLNMPIHWHTDILWPLRISKQAMTQICWVLSGHRDSYQWWSSNRHPLEVCLPIRFCKEPTRHSFLVAPIHVLIFDHPKVYVSQLFTCIFVEPSSETNQAQDGLFWPVISRPQKRALHVSPLKPSLLMEWIGEALICNRQFISTFYRVFIHPARNSSIKTMDMACHDFSGPTRIKIKSHWAAP